MDIQSMMSKIGGGQGGLGGMPGGGPPDMGGGPGAGGSPQMAIASKMGKAPRTPEAQHVDRLVIAIKALNDYADGVAQTDQANARAVRLMIGILGEILKAGQHGQIEQEDNIMGPDIGLME